MEVECENYDDAAAQYAVGTYSRQLRFPKDTMKADRYFPRTSMLTLLRLASYESTESWSMHSNRQIVAIACVSCTNATISKATKPQQSRANPRFADMYVPYGALLITRTMFPC